MHIYILSILNAGVVYLSEHYFLTENFYLSPITNIIYYY